LQDGNQFLRRSGPRASIAPAGANSEGIGAKGREARMAWAGRVKAAPAELQSEFERRDDGKLPAHWKKAITGAYAEFIASGKEMATRSASGAVLDYLAAAPAAGGRRMFRARQ
jgi:transketolase